MYLSGVEFLRQRPHLFTRLYDLVSSPAGEVRKHVLGIMIGLCKCMRGAFHCVNKAAINTARRANQSPYASLLNCLSAQDVDLRINALTLINWLVFKCPSERKAAKFLARLENLGVFDDLRQLAREKHPEVVQQLKNFQKNAKIVLPSMQYQLEIYQNRN